MSSESDDTGQSRRDRWHYRGYQRPPFAVVPDPGQESIWDYPRPPAIEPDRRRITVHLGSSPIADSRSGYRVLETAGAPTFYLPPDAVDSRLLVPSEATSFCEWKGHAQYWDVTNGERTAERAAWAYPNAGERFALVAGYIAFYAGALDCRVDGERAAAQPGGFYGGWVTRDIVGPFKGEPGTEDW